MSVEVPAFHRTLSPAGTWVPPATRIATPTSTGLGELGRRRATTTFQHHDNDSIHHFPRRKKGTTYWHAHGLAVSILLMQRGCPRADVSTRHNNLRLNIATTFNSTKRRVPVATMVTLVDGTWLASHCYTPIFFPDEGLGGVEWWLCEDATCYGLVRGCNRRAKPKVKTSLGAQLPTTPRRQRPVGRLHGASIVSC